MLSYLPLFSTGRSLEPIPSSKMIYTVKWSRCSQMNSCLSCWWELICLATLAIFQMHFSKGYSKPKIVQLQIPLAAARHMLYQPAATRASSSLPGLQHTAGSAALNITVMFKLDSVNEHKHTICYFLNALVTKSHISIKWERTFLMVPFSHGSRISLNWHFWRVL